MRILKDTEGMYYLCKDDGTKISLVVYGGLHAVRHQYDVFINADELFRYWEKSKGAHVFTNKEPKLDCIVIAKAENFDGFRKNYPEYFI
jgi:hypothetical protein